MRTTAPNDIATEQPIFATARIATPSSPLPARTR